MSREGTHLGCCAAHLSLLEPSTEAESPLLVLAAECVHYSSQQPQPESGHRAAAESAASTSQPSTSAPQTHRPTVFHGNRAPPISLVDYAKRIGKHTRVSPLCFIAALAYIDRLCREDQVLTVGPLTAHRLLLVGVLLAAKLYDDDIYKNTFFAKVGGIPVSELNTLEREMFMRLGGQLALSHAAICEALTRLSSGSWVLGMAERTQQSVHTHAEPHTAARTAPQGQGITASVDAPQAVGTLCLGGVDAQAEQHQCGGIQQLSVEMRRRTSSDCGQEARREHGFESRTRKRTSRSSSDIEVYA